MESISVIYIIFSNANESLFTYFLLILMRRGKFELEILKLIIMKRLTLLNCQHKFTLMKFLKIPIKQTATNYSILSWKRMQYIISSSRSLPPQFVNIHVKKDFTCWYHTIHISERRCGGKSFNRFITANKGSRLQKWCVIKEI